MEQIIEVSEIKNSNNCNGCNRCPDYDEDCLLVLDHLRCFIGFELTDGVAKGYCPFIHTEN